MTWITGDAFDLLPQLDADSADVVITDPPYNAKTENARTLAGGAGVAPAGIVWSLSDRQVEDLTRELLRITQRWILVFCALEQLGAYQKAAGDCWIRAGVWDRNDSGAPQFTGDRPAQGAEGIAIMHRGGRKRWNNGGHRAIWRHNVVRTKSKEEPRVHPAQKPRALIRDLVEAFSEPGELILDPFAGSGVVHDVGQEAARRVVSIELDERWSR